VLWCGAAAVMCDGGANIETEKESRGSQRVSGNPDGKGGQGEAEGSFPPESETVIKSVGAGDGKDPKQQNGVVMTPPTNPDRKEEEREKEKENVVTEQTQAIAGPKKGERKSQLTPTRDEEEPPAEGVKTPQGAASSGEEIVLLEDHSDQSHGGKNPADVLAAEMSSGEKGKAPKAPPSIPNKNEKREVDLKATTNNEKENLENVASVKKTEILLDDEEATSNQRNEGLASTTGNQESEPSNSHAELTPPSISAASNASNDDADKDTNKGNPNNDSAAGGAATEGAHQDGKKEERAEEKTPLKSVPSINDTATPGNSDGSTAVSHTTSPLLPL
ncbi:mucin-associated surface protein (MASP), partial [Trypanosoma cruzi]